MSAMIRPWKSISGLSSDKSLTKRAYLNSLPKDGKYGWLVPADCRQVLADAIEPFLDGRLPSSPRASRAPFHLDFITDRYLSLVLGA